MPEPAPAPWTAAPYTAQDASAIQGDYAAVPVPAPVPTPAPAPPPAHPPTRRRRGGIVAAAVLVAAAAAVTAGLLSRQGADPADGAERVDPLAADVTATGDTDVAATSAAPSLTVTETVTAPAPTVTETITPSPAAPSASSPSAGPARSDDDDAYCGATGTLVALGYSARFEVVLCDEGTLVYVGTNLQTGNGITLDAQRAGDGFSAINGETQYSVTSGGLYVTDSSGVLVDEAWQIWMLY